MKGSLDRIFDPKSIAVFGVSHSDKKFGYRFLKSLLDVGFCGKIYPINPKGGNILGIPVARSIFDVKDRVDLACITAPAESVPDILKDCLKAGIPGAEILSSGFSEVGRGDLEDEVKKIARSGLRIVGPNCFGIFSPKVGLTFLPGYNFKKKEGNLGFFSQSGGLLADFIKVCEFEQIFFSKAISYGNGADIDEVDLLEYFLESKETRVLGIYLEGPKRPKDFVKKLKEIARKKPVILWRAGLFESGKRAAMSHTGSLGADPDIWRGIISQTKAISVSSFEDLLDIIKIFYFAKEKRPIRNLSLLSGGGGISVVFCDECEKFDMYVPPFSESTQKKMKTLLPKSGISYKNPIDSGNPMVPKKALYKIAETVLSEPYIDGFVFIHHIYYFLEVKAHFEGKDKIEILDECFQAVDVLEEVSNLYKKPIFIVIPRIDPSLDSYINMVKERYHKKSIPVYHSLKSLLISLYRANLFYKFSTRKSN